MKPPEAVWAEFLKRVDWKVTYRRGGLLIAHGERPLLILPTDALTEHRLAGRTDYAERRANGAEWVDDVLAAGGHPLPSVRSYLGSDPAAGLLGQRVGCGYQPDPLAPDDGPPKLVYQEAGWVWAPALWMRCDVCGRLGVYHETRSWAARPCGHDRGPWHSDDANVAAIGRTWAEASYAVSRRKTLRTNTTKETTV
jgi:hypothetical protein